jgi:UDP-hydrolysing UDP-N-acetyl-D-glucosamine 2-epimerase
MRKRKKLIVAVTNRSSYNKIKTVLKNLPDFIEPVLALGNSIYFYRYGYAYQNIKQDFPDIKIIKSSMSVEGDTLVKMPQSVGVGLLELANVFDNEKPDMVVTIADRYETTATAISASFMNIPLAHLQGGEISGTVDDDVRNLITQLATYHFPATNDAADRIMQMKGKDHDKIWAFGCPSMDLLKMTNTDPDDVNKHGHGDEIDTSDQYILVMLHPDTKGSLIDVEMVMDVLNEFPAQKIIFWPNIDPSNDKIAKVWRMKQEGYWKSPVRYVRHLDHELFGDLLINSDCIIGNSSAGIREATFTGTPSITIGDRQNGRECGVNVMHVPFNSISITNALIEQLCHGSYYSNTMYGTGNAGKLIAFKIGELI